MMVTLSSLGGRIDTLHTPTEKSTLYLCLFDCDITVEVLVETVVVVTSSVDI